MSTRTYELTIWPGAERRALMEFLDSSGIHDYIEAATDSINADDVDWSAVFDAWSQDENAPLMFYRASEDEARALQTMLEQALPGALQFAGKWIADDLWQSAWEPGFEQLETERFFIAAEGQAAPKGKIALQLESGAVFGSGQHATTQALVRLMEAQPRATAGSNFLDVGTGTGVLAFVAHHLGYSRLVATDIEENAIDCAKANSARNAIPLELHLTSEVPADETFATIACNILPPTLTDLFPSLAKALKPQGLLYLAGFNEANADQVEAALERIDFAVIETRRERGWLAWLAKAR